MRSLPFFKKSRQTLPIRLHTFLAGPPEIRSMHEVAIMAGPPLTWYGPCKPFSGTPGTRPRPCPPRYCSFFQVPVYAPGVIGGLTYQGNWFREDLWTFASSVYRHVPAEKENYAAHRCHSWFGKAGMTVVPAGPFAVPSGCWLAVLFTEVRDSKSISGVFAAPP